MANDYFPGPYPSRFRTALRVERSGLGRGAAGRQAQRMGRFCLHDAALRPALRRHSLSGRPAFPPRGRSRPRYRVNATGRTLSRKALLNKKALPLLSQSLLDNQSLINLEPSRFFLCLSRGRFGRENALATPRPTEDLKAH